MKQQSNDRFDYYVNGQYSQYLLEARTAGSSPIGIFKSSQPAGNLSDPPSLNMVLVMAIEKVQNIQRDYGAGRFDEDMMPGSFDLVAPGAATEIHASEPHHIFILDLPFHRIRELLEPSMPNFNGDFGKLHGCASKNLKIERIIWQIWQEAAKDNPYGNLYADGLLMQLVAELLRESNPKHCVQTDKSTHALSYNELARINDYVEANIDENLTIDDIAKRVNMPSSTFYKLFKQTLNQTPFQFILDKRLTSAQDMIRQNQLPLSDIAYACGFSSQQHMNTLFKKRLSITPAQYLKETR